MLKPDYEYKSIFDIEPDFFYREDIKYLLIDIDNTLVADNAPDATDEAIDFLLRLHNDGIKFCLVSNNSHERVQSFNKGLNYPAVFKAGKPKKKKLNEALKNIGADKKHSALIGDQIFTDLLAAKNAKIRMILVNPINTDIENRFFRFKRFCENLVFKRRI